MNTYDSGVKSLWIPSITEVAVEWMRTSWAMLDGIWEETSDWTSDGVAVPSSAVWTGK